MVVSLQGVNFTSQQVFKGFKVSEHIFEVLAFMGMFLVSFCSSRDYQSHCHSHFQSVILALFSDWEIYFIPEQTFLHLHSPFNILKMV